MRELFEESLEKMRMKFAHIQSVWSYKADSLRPLRIYLDAHYRHVKTFTNVLRNEAWIRKGETDAPITPANQSTRK